jgi:hypothetical protein
MARIDWIEQGLHNWARWKCSAGLGALGFSHVNLEAAIGNDRSDEPEARIPTIDCEASAYDDAVNCLPSELKATVYVVYLSPAGMKKKADRLCCTPATVDARIWRAHRMLADHFLARQDRARRERERVEAAQRASRPTG